MGNSINDGGGKISYRKLPFVWNLEYNGIKSVAIGTHHATTTNFEKDISDKLTGIESVFLEVNPEENLNEAFLKYKDEWSRSYGRFSAEDLHKLEPLLDAMTGGRMKQMNCFREATSSTKIGTLLYGVDRTVGVIAQKMGLKIDGLETQQEHLAFGKMAYSPLQKLLERITPEQIPNALCMLPLIKMLTEEMNKAYEKGDGVPFISMAQRMPAELYQKNLERNKIMAERALPVMKTKPVAIAVGAAHLLCEPSILNYFEKEGVKIERVR